MYDYPKALKTTHFNLSGVSEPASTVIYTFHDHLFTLHYGGNRIGGHLYVGTEGSKTFLKVVHSRHEAHLLMEQYAATHPKV